MSPRRTAARALAHADTYATWRDAAREVDDVTGALDWRADDTGFESLRDTIRTLDDLRASEAVLPLAEHVHAELARTLGDLDAAGLYDTALSGPKDVVTDYLSALEQAMRWLADTAAVPAEEKLRHFRRAQRLLGRTALVLSGGATLGFHHLGVVKALLEADALPRVMSGASTGAMIAAGMCTRTDDELRALFADVSVIARNGLVRAGLRDQLASRAWLDPNGLYDVLKHNCGEWTFAEAYRRTGRVLNIAVSPTQTRQRPRLLCHLTAPDVLVASGALASSALPGLFPPIVLEQRTRDGVVPYAPRERWIDGSMREDLPMSQLARLHDVSHFVVSQTNPHVLPFVSAKGRVGAALGLLGHSARIQAAHGAEVGRRVAGRSMLRPVFDTVHAVMDQAHRGDIDIHPRLRPKAYLRMAANPTLDELRTFVFEGERATWPRIAQIRDQLRIRRVLAACVERCKNPDTVRLSAK